MMRRIDFDSLSWAEPGEGVRAKSVNQRGQQIRIAEFAPGFRKVEWCCKAHIGYVLAGDLEVVFADGAEVFSPGDALIIAAGDKHRARVIKALVRLFLAEES